MNKLIEFFNKKYGKEYGKIAYPRTTIQIYRVYQAIKSYGIKDEELVKLLHNVKLPNPKSIEEKELYADCLYNKDDSEIAIDTSNLISKESPVFTGSISLGRKEGTAIGENSVAIGKNVEASGSYSHAEGNGTIASGFGSHAEGLNCVASGESSHAEGRKTIASSDYQHTQGKYNIEDNNNKYAHIVGNGTETTKSNAHTLDWKGNAWYAGDVQANNVPCIASEKVVLTVPAATITGKKTEIDKATGNNPVTITVNSALIYDPTKSYYLKYSNKQYSALINDDTFLIMEDGFSSLTIIPSDSSSTLVICSLDTTNVTDMQLIEKDIRKLDNIYLSNDIRVNNSITLGVRTGKIGEFSSSFGSMCEASGVYSHAEGTSTVASGIESHAEGDSTTASGDCSHAEGWSTTSSGNYSHAEGNDAIASGEFSHAEGNNTIASGESQHVQGKYNISDTEEKYAHIVGNGTSKTARKNAHTLDWEGNAWFAGKLSQDGTPTEDKDLTTKKYVDTSLENKVDKSQLSFNSNGELVVTINGVTKIFTPKV